MLLEEAYEAAVRLKQAHDAGAEIQPPGDELGDTAETARRDLDRIFNTGGVAALVGNTPADYDPAAFQGIHARYVLVINDEAGVSRSRSSMRSTPWQRTSTLVWSQSGSMIPPPTSPRSANQAPVGMWRRSARSTRPHTPGERVPDDLLPLLVSPEWVEERKVRWGVTSPIYQSKVLGEFPDISDDTLILPSGSKRHRSEPSNALAARSSPPTSHASVSTRP
jgi:hypothetical protein